MASNPESAAVLARSLRQSRLALGLSLTSCVGLACAATMAASKPQGPNEINAERFNVVDATGKKRAQFGIYEDNGGCGMVIYDEQGREQRMLILVEPELGGIILLDTGADGGGFQVWGHYDGGAALTVAGRGHSAELRCQDDAWLQVEDSAGKVRKFGIEK